MWNIIKAQNYQARNDLVIVVSLLFIGAMCLSPLIENPHTDFSEFTGSFFATNSNISFLLILILILSTRICGWDMSDKTINYEILSGHSRTAVFFGRIITSSVWAAACCAVLMFAPLAVCTLFNGWGHTVDFSGLLLRYLLAFLPILRINCEFALITFLVRNGGLSAILNYLLIDGLMIAEMIYSTKDDRSLSILFGVSNFMKLTDFSNYRYGFVDGKDVVIFDSSLEPTFIIGTIAASVLVAGACLLLGSVVFKKSDLK